ncbi:MAG: flagellar motor switch protein FliM [Rhodobacteraceae bacterium HLUCCA12]|nr:MAG: flagellar motor switch protein FliM [Rhodobacteraceae bacterium HLUCCA12]
MVDFNGDSILRRKLAPRPDVPAFDLAELPDLPDPGGRLLPRSFTRSCSRVADLVARARVCASRGVTLNELVDLPEAEGFTALLIAEGAPPGLVILDPVVFSSVIEAMTVGRLMAIEPAMRRATVTDAALVAELVDATLAELDANADPEEPFAAGYRLGPLADDLRLLDVMLEDVAFALTSLDVDLLDDGVTRHGRVTIALPEPAVSTPPFEGFDLPFQTEPAPDTHWEQALEASVMAAPAQMFAVLGRVTMPLSRALELDAGSCLTLPLSQLEEVALETLDNQPMALGRLGQYRGMRALRLTSLLAGAEGDSAPGPAAEPPEPTRPALGRDLALPTGGEGE